MVLNLETLNSLVLEQRRSSYQKISSKVEIDLLICLLSVSKRIWWSARV